MMPALLDACGKADHDANHHRRIGLTVACVSLRLRESSRSISQRHRLPSGVEFGLWARMRSCAAARPSALDPEARRIQL